MRLARWVGGLLATTIAAAGCGGGSGGGGDTSEQTVPTPAVALSDAQAVETGAGAALTFIAALRALSGDAPATSGIAAMSDGPAQAAQCLNGGVLAANCRADGGRAVVTSRAAQCELLDAASGYRVTLDGELRVTIAAPDVCRSGELPDALPRTYRYRQFQAVVRDGPRVVEAFDAPQLTEKVTPLGGARQADVELSGRVGIRRDDGTDIRIDSDRLRLARRLDGGAAARVVGNGVATFSDAAGGRTVRAALHDLVLSAGTRLSGDADLACAGGFGFEVETDGAATCPSGSGSLRLPSGAAAEIGLDGGVSLDADGNGVPEQVVSSCRDLVVVGCE
ncbi:MAG: hypothetical protein SF182_04805 [Deltaproteobacteria bacterium]|nr:hypothetical protein [Deltaproteobacteria bacterium]